MDEQGFTSRDLRQMAEIGVAPEDAARQVELFRRPPPFTRLVRPCSLGDGIRELPRAEHAGLLALFDEAARNGRIGKLVPASGAATRMFKDLLAFRAGAPDGAPPPAVAELFASLPRFAFYEELAAVLRAGGVEIEEAVRRAEHRSVLGALLDFAGLGYAELPKGLLRFHRYPEGPRTPFEEHLVEAAALCRGADGLCRVHFTVSPDHLDAFSRLAERVGPGLEARLGCRFEVTFSTQRRATDTLAVDPLDQPFRQADGSLLFRPGGHGALLANLNDLGRQGWDIVFLKNVDNVVRDDSKPLVHLWKKLLGGLLVSAQQQAPDRPLRVCGVVRNQGEPGGGPFWVQSASGSITPQIVEASQVDPSDPQQQAILRSSTHFNPVDIVCGLRDRQGAPYDLDRYVDPATVFISTKTHEGRPLKALERPGLWNGAMAEWNTVFVEVPEATFAPVKTVLDLLRPEHQERTENL